MPHHSDQPLPEETRKQLEELQAKFDSRRFEDLKDEYFVKPGPTGKFPEGKVNESDEGEIQFLVGSQDGKVYLDFGTPVKWLAFGPEMAEEVANLLIKHASMARNQ